MAGVRARVSSGRANLLRRRGCLHSAETERAALHCSASRGYPSAVTHARSGLSDADSLAQDFKRCPGGNRERRGLLWEAVPAGRGGQERYRVYPVPSQGGRIPLAHAPVQQALSLLTKDEVQTWFRSMWTDVRGASTREGHPAPYPVELAGRLIRMFSFAGDTILDPFAGSCSTLVAAIHAGRNSIGIDIEPSYVEDATGRIEKELQAHRFDANTTASLSVF